VAAVYSPRRRESVWERIGRGSSRNRTRSRVENHREAGDVIREPLSGRYLAPSHSRASSSTRTNSAAANSFGEGVGRKSSVAMKSRGADKIDYASPRSRFFRGSPRGPAHPYVSIPLFPLSSSPPLSPLHRIITQFEFFRPLRRCNTTRVGVSGVRRRAYRVRHLCVKNDSHVSNGAVINHRATRQELSFLSATRCRRNPFRDRAEIQAHRSATESTRQNINKEREREREREREEGGEEERSGDRSSLGETRNK